MKLRDAYQNKLDAQIEELNARLALMRAKAKGFAADARIAAHEELSDTDAKLARLKARMGKLRVAGDGAWQEMKVGVESAWTELSTAAKRAKKRFDPPAPPKTRAR
jgi:hypothetical protein